MRLVAIVNTDHPDGLQAAVQDLMRHLTEVFVTNRLIRKTTGYTYPDPIQVIAGTHEQILTFTELATHCRSYPWHTSSEAISQSPASPPSFVTFEAADDSFSFRLNRFIRQCDQLSVFCDDTWQPLIIASSELGEFLKLYKSARVAGTESIAGDVRLSPSIETGCRIM